MPRGGLQALCTTHRLLLCCGLPRKRALQRRGRRAGSAGANQPGRGPSRRTHPEGYAIGVVCAGTFGERSSRSVPVSRMAARKSRAQEAALSPINGASLLHVGATVLIKAEGLIRRAFCRSRLAKCCDGDHTSIGHRYACSAGLAPRGTVL